MTGGCAEIATGCCCFGQRFVQSSHATRLAPTNPVSSDTVHEDRRYSPNELCALRPSTDQIGSLEALGALIAVSHLSVHTALWMIDTEG